jgi:hypothetical protein
METNQAAHAAPDSDQLTGVWVHTRPGNRVEILRHGDLWRVYLYLTRKRRFSSAQFEFDDPTKLRECIRGLEEQGHVRDPARVPDYPLDPFTGQTRRS